MASNLEPTTFVTHNSTYIDMLRERCAFGGPSPRVRNSWGGTIEFPMEAMKDIGAISFRDFSPTYKLELESLE